MLVLPEVRMSFIIVDNFFINELESLHFTEIIIVSREKSNEGSVKPRPRIPIRTL